MEYVIGFIIALFIALTGVGAGTITVPILVLFLGVPAATAVGIGLMFAAAVKAILVPAPLECEFRTPLYARPSVPSGDRWDR